MLRSRQLDLFACLTLLLGGVVQGCASSAIGDLELDDGQLASEQSPSSSDAGSSTSEEDDDESAPVVTKKDASVKDAAAATGANDAGKSDAGKPDANSPAVDASAPKDAGAASAKDAGTTTMKDAGATTAKDAGSDAGSSTTPEPTGECSKDSDCTQSCVPLGLFQCCSNHKCGCTWAPGTYCF
jgi:hypothetical protein